MTQRWEGNMSHVDDGTLHAYLDGELPPAERAALEAHVALCAPCHAKLVDERALIDRAGTLLALAQPAERAAPPLQQLSNRPVRRPWHVRTPVAWAASVVLALVVGYSLRGSGSDARIAEPVAIDAVADGFLARAETASANAEPARVLGWQKTPPAPAETTRLVNPPAAGVVAIGPPAPRARVAVPAPVPVATERDELAAANAAPPAPTVGQDRALAGAVTGTRNANRLLATEWPIIRRGSARDLLGTDPVGVPGLAVRQIRRSPADGTVLVEQQIDSSTIIQLYQRAAVSEREAQPMRELRRDASPAAGASVSKVATADRLARFVGGLRVEISGPLSQDSPNRLLEQLKPLP
jgi:anti-sigma factor RsiW